MKYHYIIKKLKDDNIKIGYFFLDGDYQTIHDRFLKRGESEESWRMQNVKMCIEAQNNDLNAISFISFWWKMGVVRKVNDDL